MVVGDLNSDGIGDIGAVIEDMTLGTTEVSLYLSQPTIALFPTAINFGPIKVGHLSAPVSVQVSNAGNRKLSISSIKVSGSFVERNNCPQKLGIGGTCTIQVTFKPLTQGTLTGSIQITDSALGLSQQISLTGVGK
jgi:hypothetical protein